MHFACRKKRLSAIQRILKIDCPATSEIGEGPELTYSFTLSWNNVGAREWRLLPQQMKSE